MIKHEEKLNNERKLLDKKTSIFLKEKNINDGVLKTISEIKTYNSDVQLVLNLSGQKFLLNQVTIKTLSILSSLLKLLFDQHLSSQFPITDSSINKSCIEI